jgi:hydroxymethylbilane synthase
MKTLAVIAFLDDPATRFAVTAERIALAALGGGCQVPIGVHCRVVSGTGCAGEFEILGAVADMEGVRLVSATAVGRDANELGQAIAAELLNRGAGELFQGIGTH